MIMGTGFPPFRGGLLRYADALGLPYILARLDDLSQKHGPRFRATDAAAAAGRARREVLSVRRHAESPGDELRPVRTSWAPAPARDLR